MGGGHVSREGGGGQLVLLQCTARYPAPLHAIDVRAIPWMAQRFGVACGTLRSQPGPARGAACRGSRARRRVIEKHYTLSNRLPGPDHSFALEPAELRAMVTGIRDVEAVLGRASNAFVRRRRNSDRMRSEPSRPSVPSRPGRPARRRQRRDTTCGSAAKVCIHGTSVT